MDVIFAEWLYSRLMMLTEQTMDDLTYNSVEFEGHTYTIEAAIHRILQATKDYIWYHEMVCGYEEDPPDEELEKMLLELKTAIRLWTEIMAYCDRCVISKRALRRMKKDTKIYQYIDDKLVEVKRGEHLS